MNKAWHLNKLPIIYGLWVLEDGQLEDSFRQAPISCWHCNWLHQMDSTLHLELHACSLRNQPGSRGGGLWSQSQSQQSYPSYFGEYGRDEPISLRVYSGTGKGSNSGPHMGEDICLGLLEKKIPPFYERLAISDPCSLPQSKRGRK